MSDEVWYPATFTGIMAANMSRCQRWHPGYPTDSDWTIADWSNAMCGEAGEAANVVKKLRRLETGTRGDLDPDEASLEQMLSDEIADVFLYLNLLAMKRGIDMPTAIARKFNIVSERQGFPERVGDDSAA